jgi:glycogen synthase
MVTGTIYFQIHQPQWLHPGREQFLWDEKNKELLTRAVKELYIPTIDKLIELVQKQDMKFACGISGTFLEQAEKYHPILIDKIRDLFTRSHFEMLDESHYNSFAALFSDKTEHKKQVSLHRTKIRELFGVDATVVRYTERFFNNDIAKLVSEMGLKSMIADIPGNDVDKLYRAGDITVIPRDITLSRIPPEQIKGEYTEYINLIGNTHSNYFCLGFPLERIGQNRDFYFRFLKHLAKHKNIQMKIPNEMAGIDFEQLQVLDVTGFSINNWNKGDDATNQTHGLVVNDAQLSYMKRVESLEKEVREVGDPYLRNWRYFTAIDNLRLLNDSFAGNPYGNAVNAAYILSEKLTGFEYALKHHFNIIKERQRPTVLQCTPEPGDLPDSFGPLAKYVKGTIGGIGILFPSLVKGLQDRGWKVIIAAPNLKKRFEEKSGMTREQRIAMRYNTDPMDIELVNSPVFDYLWNPYEGDQAENAAVFQQKVAEDILLRRKSEAKGSFIVHGHDAMGGGLIVAKANARNIPVVQSVHSSHEIYIPRWRFGKLDNSIHERLFLLGDNVYSLATAIRNSWRTVMVSEGWLGDHLQGYHPDVIVPSTRKEIIEKHRYGAIDCIINSPSPERHPENSEYLKNPYQYFKHEAAELIAPFGPNDNLIEAKKRHLIAFQKETGLRVDPDAILLLYCARADRYQKSVHWVEDTAQGLINYFANRGISVQFGFVSEGVGKTYQERKKEEDILGRVAWLSNSTISYRSFNQPMDALGNAASHIGVGPSRFEPCGQNNIMSWLYGAIFIGTDTGGYHVNIEELRLAMNGATHDHGNGFKFRYDIGEFWNAMVRAVETIHQLKQNPGYYALNMKRIMEKTRLDFGIDKMIAAQIGVYENCLRYAHNL